MACATVVGDNLAFGVSSEEGASLVTQSISVTRKADKKEARDKCGIVVAVCYYNETSDISIEGLGTSTNEIAAALTINNSFGNHVVGAVYIDEISVEMANEEFVKSTIQATAYSGISP